MMAENSTARRLLLSSLIIVLILTAVVILDGPPTLTNKALAQPNAVANYGYYGYYGSYCYPFPYCNYVPLIIKKLVR